METFGWLNAQDKIGCKTCAKFFNKKAINWTPMHAEFLFKNILPNYDYILQTKARRVHDVIKDNKNTMIFSSNVKELARALIDIIEKKEKPIDINSQSIDLDSLSLSLLLKESNIRKKFFEKPPIDIGDGLSEYRQHYYNNFNKLNWLDNGLLDGLDENTKCEPSRYMKSLLNNRD